MFIVLHCGGMPFSGNSFSSQSLGGSETAAYYMARELSCRGHQVTVFTNENTECVTDGVKYVWAGNITKETPLGHQFDMYATNTPVDVLVIQRSAGAFVKKYEAKLNLWWLHDLAMYRNKSAVTTQLYNIDGVFTVSEYHKNQVHDVYGIDKDFITTLNNGVDLDLYKFSLNDITHLDFDETKFNLLYSSRPERGLESLVMHDGIMEKLLKVDPEIHLNVCMYSNYPPHLKAFYEMLFKRCEELPNVTNLGSLNKEELAKVQTSSNLYCYPTEFEEVSCITAMEAMAAGTPFLSSDVAALPETCLKNVKSGSRLLKLDKDGLADIDLFCSHITSLKSAPIVMREMEIKQLKAAKFYAHKNAADVFENTCKEILQKKMSNKGSVARSMIRNSDIMRLKKWFKDNVSDEDIEEDAILAQCKKELDELYKFSDNEEAYNEHYQKLYEFCKNEKNVTFGPENLERDSRFNSVANFITNTTGPIRILDFGCAHGHYSYNLAKRFANAEVVGLDIAAVNIQAAKEIAKGKYAEQGFAALSNLRYSKCSMEGGEIKPVEQIPLKYDYIVVGEILEHLIAPEKYLTELSKWLAPDGIFIATTPYGPWEHINYEQEHPWRAHLWHFEKEEIYAMYSDRPNFNLKCVPYTQTNSFETIGSFTYSFSKGERSFYSALQEVPVKLIAPKETISMCMIAKDAENSILDCLERVVNLVDEIIIGVDVKTKDQTIDVIHKLENERKLWPIFKVFDMESPLDVGFDECRNQTLKRANGDWILWVDTDEKLSRGEFIHLHTRYSPVQGYMVPQHHFSVHPVGLLKTDLPVRLFRNHKGIKFFGKVHEHPEKKLNEGVGFALPAANVCISHNSYEDENIRRGRFYRNFDLLVKDRVATPERKLGKFLWVRDLAQMCQFEIEQGIPINEEMLERAEQGIKLWKEMLDDNGLRMAIDALPYYSTLCRIKGGGFSFATKLDASLEENLGYEQGVEIKGVFVNKDHINALLTNVLNEKVKDYGSKYY
jgi:glycosyltransferase involved in cell wall biosynthesis/2-polyprenyl-3-methyl-5-hydroxy-6-metoxy-1,4-benzoquinol methylase